MKNFTLKFTVLILFVLVFQAQAQVESGTTYTFRNVATGNYLSTGGGNGWLYAPVANKDDTENKTSFLITSINDAFTIEGTRGLMVIRGNGVIGQSTTKTTAANIAADRQINFEKITINGNDVYFLHRDSKYVRENTQEEVDNDTYPSIVSGVDADASDQRQMWFLEAVTLSTIAIAKSSVFMSNPVKENVSISGLAGEINQIHIYSLLGAKVVSQEVKTLSSLQLNVSGLSKGTYIVNFIGDNGNFTKKLIKE